jgi:hypothetical protein
MRATRIVPLVALGALLVPHWFAGPEKAWAGVLGYFGGILVTLLVLIVRTVWRERRHHMAGIDR